MSEWAKKVSDFYGEMPHPQAPEMKVKELPTAIRLASMAKFGGHASVKEAQNFWKEFQGLGMTPEEFEQTLDRLGPLSFSFLGRPPTMKEITKFKEESPQKIKDYYYNQPDKHHPEVPSGEMIRYLKMGETPAQEHVARKPVKYEAAQFYASGMNAQSVAQHYQSQAPPKEDPSGRQGSDPGRGKVLDQS